MIEKTKAQLVHYKFKTLSGSDEIASEMALDELLNLLNHQEVKSVLEIGSGIGTMTFLIQAARPDALLVCFERNDWCQSQLAQNCNLDKAKLIKTNAELLDLNTHFDLILIDDYIDLGATKQLIKNSCPKWVFIEGHRRIQRMAVFIAYFRSSRRFRFSTFGRGANSDKGGCVFENNQGIYLLSPIGALAIILLGLAYSNMGSLRRIVPGKIRKNLANRFTI
jgi:hypothetical protein